MMDYALIDSLDLSMRSFIAAQKLGCKTVGDIRAKGKSGFLSLPGVGLKVIRDITSVIGEWPDGKLTKPTPAFIPPKYDLSGYSTESLLAEIKRRIG